MPESYLYRGEYARSLLAKGETEGMVKVVLKVLDSRGVVLSDSDRERISACNDAACLELWLGRVALISTADELFA
ncbi:hypothetical protein AB0F17_58920 [Nonomuraea sp. NPDC026600]|uniref:hypothetical protein n=1 Tax=Nonomuraea sp. NPDC026600 TaxID=3155363 RepID=UPI0033D43E7F